MNYTRAVLGGIVGGAVMSLLMAAGRAMGMQANLEMMLGTMFGAAPGPGTWMLGFAMHLVISALIAVVYGWGFEYLTHRSGWSVGFGFAVVHAVIAGVVMGMIPAIHPLIPEQMPAPGAFMSNLGMIGIAAEFMLHVVYGAIVGAMYGPVRPAAATTVAERSQRAA
jgi:hypothetical protein